MIVPSKRKEALNTKRRRGRKKIVLLLVEGQSDVEALAEPLANTIYAFDPNIEFYPLYLGDKTSSSSGSSERGDVTSKNGVDPKTIEHVIDKLYLQPFFQCESLYPKDIARIVHIVDTDGAFIPHNRVLPADVGSVSHEYREDAIVTPNVFGIIERNERKAANLIHLATLSAIKTGYDRKKRAMPYSVFFFSSNLDHFLHGNANLDKYKKVLRAKEFADNCSRTPSLFFDTVQSDTAFIDCGYSESWSQIREGCNSLQRHTNIGVLINELQQYIE